MSEGRFNLSALAVRERAITLFLILLISLAGVVSFFKLGRAEDPSFTIKVMTIITAWPGATAQEMQDQVTEKIEKRLQELTVVDQLPADRNRVFFGAWVTLEDDAGESHCYRLVGPDETGADKRYINIDSPLARALLKKALDDEIRVQTPVGEMLYVVIAIAYGASPESVQS